MEYDPQDYYSDGEDTPDEPTPAQPTPAQPTQTSGVEKPDAQVRRSKKKPTEAKLEQLRKAREAKAKKRKERLNTAPAKKPRKDVVRQLPPVEEEESETEEIVVAPPQQKRKRKKKRIIVQAPPPESSSDDEYEAEYVYQHQPQTPPRQHIHYAETDTEHQQTPSSIFY